MNNMTGSKFTTQLSILKMHLYRVIDLVDLQGKYAKSKPDYSSLHFNSLLRTANVYQVFVTFDLPGIQS